MAHIAKVLAGVSARKSKGEKKIKTTNWVIINPHI
jgi:hypothetical protein